LNYDTPEADPNQIINDFASLSELLENTSLDTLSPDVESEIESIFNESIIDENQLTPELEVVPDVQEVSVRK